MTFHFIDSSQGGLKNRRGEEGMVSRVLKKVLIVDDDPYHLEIYGMLVRRAGYEPVPVVVQFEGAEFPPDDEMGLIVLDYKLNTFKTTEQLARELKAQYQGAPILLLSDVWDMPLEMKAHVSAFVRKGEPDKLFDTLHRLLPLLE